MAEREITFANHGILLAEEIVRNEKNLDSLFAENKTRKHAFLHYVANRLENNRGGQIGFLNSLFEMAAKEGQPEPETTDRRDAATEILSDSIQQGINVSSPITPMITTNQEVVGEAYIRSLGRQTKENDPLSGSIATLLDIGKAIAPYLTPNNKQALEISIHWKRIEQQFPTPHEQNIIKVRAKEIRKKIFPIEDIDANIQTLRKQKLSFPKIAELLGQELSTVNNSARRLVNAGEIEKSKRTKEQMTIFRGEIADMKRLGKSVPEIAKLKGHKPRYIQKVVNYLIDKDTIKRARATPEYMAELAEKIKPYVIQGLSGRQISEIFPDEPYDRVRYEARKVRRE